MEQKIFIKYRGRQTKGDELIHYLKIEHCSTRKEMRDYIIKYLGDKYDVTTEITKEGEKCMVWDKGCDVGICADPMLDARNNLKKEDSIENFEIQMSSYDTIEYCARRLGSSAEKVLEETVLGEK